MLAKIIRLGVPAIGQTSESLARELLAAGIQLGAEEAAKMRALADEWLRAHLTPDEYNVYRQPNDTLARALGLGLASAAKGRPLLMLLDTYEIVARELELAIRWDRPSILLAVYSSVYVMGDAAAALEAQLREGGQQVIWVRVNGETDADIPLRLAEHPQRNGAVFFVSGLQWGGKTALRALNIRREYFVDQRLRAVFWLTENEVVAIAREAPDFWAFRHRVVEFVEPPGPGRAATMARDIAWAGFEDRTLREDTEAKIALREALLADLPEGDETLAARAELLYTLGGLYSADRQYGWALESVNAALEAARRTDNTRLEARCHHGLGNLYRDLGRHEEAEAEFRRAIELDPKSAYPHNGLGNLYRDLGRHQEAEAAYRRAIELDPQWASPHHNLADEYLQLGRLEEASQEFEERVRLSPDDALGAQGALGVIARHRGDAQTAQTHFEKALAIWDTAWQRKLQTPAGLLENKAIALLGLGRPDEALATLRDALAQRLPGDTIDLYMYDLLAAAPEPPEGLDEVLALLREAAE